MTSQRFSIAGDDTAGSLKTSGLRAAGYNDFLVQRLEPSLRDASRELLDILARYQIERDVRVDAGEKIRHGYWTLEMHDGARPAGSTEREEVR